MSNCPPRRLNIFLKTLDAKLALMKANSKNCLRTPPSVLRREMLEGLPNVIENLSPLGVAEIQELLRFVIGQNEASEIRFYLCQKIESIWLFSKPNRKIKICRIFKFSKYNNSKTSRSKFLKFGQNTCKIFGQNLVKIRVKYV